MRIREAVLQIAARISRYATLAKSTGPGIDAIDGPASGEDEPKSQEPARRMSWYAFRSVPPVGSECAVIAGRAGSTNKMIVGADHRGFGKTDMSEGEAQIFTRFGQSIFLDKDGATTSTAAGSTVKQDKDGNIVLTSKGGAVLTMDDGSKVSEHDELFKSTHYGGRGGTPTVALIAGGGALGAGGTIALSPQGTDSVFRFSMKTDPANPPPGAGDFAKITFAKPYTKAPEVFLQPTNSDSAAPGANGPGGTWWYSSTASEITVKTAGTLQQNTTYGLAVWVIES